MSEWDAVKEGLRRIEVEPLSNAALPGAVPSYQMLINARFAHALRLIMESLEAMA